LSQIKGPILLPVGPPGIQTVKVSSTMFQTEIRFAFVINVGGVLEGYGWGIKEATWKKTRTVQEIKRQC